MHDHVFISKAGTGISMPGLRPCRVVVSQGTLPSALALLRWPNRPSKFEVKAVGIS